MPDHWGGSGLDEQRQIQAKREEVMDALSPEGSVGWMRAHTRRLRYKPGWAFSVYDGRDPLGFGDGHYYALDHLPQLVVKVSDRYRHRYPRVAVPDFSQPGGSRILEWPSNLPPDFEGQEFALRMPIYPGVDTVAEFVAMALRAIDEVERELTKKWLRHE